MPGADIADYGIAFFSIAVLAYVLVQLFLHQNNNKKQDMGGTELVQVIDNNTKALKELIGLIHAMETTLVRQETKLDELLDRVRHADGKGE